MIIDSAYFEGYAKEVESMASKGWARVPEKYLPYGMAENFICYIKEVKIKWQEKG